MEAVLVSRQIPVWQDRRAIALLMAASLTTMANATIAPALPGLERLFAGDPNAALLTRLLVPAPSLSVALIAPLAGIAADRIGRRRLLLFGVILFVLSGCAGLVLPDLPTIFASRLVLGVAVALIMTAQTALIGDYFTGDDRNALTGLQISARNLGGLVFILTAGWVATISPRLPFAIYGLAAAFLPLMWLVIVDPPRLAQASGAKLAGDRGDYHRWLLPLALLVLLQGTTNMIFFIMPTQLSFFLDAQGYDSAIMTGSALGVLMLSGGGCALLYPRIQRAVGYAGIFALGYGAMALGFLMLLFASTTPAIFAAVAAIGAGYALVSPSFVALALNLAPGQKRGLAGGILTASIFIGQFCSPLLSTPVIAGFGYANLFAGTAGLLAIMTVTAALTGGAGWLRRR
ncbi:Predicted arabinose efflux permease, MFS family [Bosea sp. 62]|uniref:MFS transporter n=2 Tax=Bosea TaxID=85413 RepID=UPI00125A0869|nr:MULTISPECIES: MFS transporter [unclassified Bosea (in: a-proteobacteria)]VXB70139.1 Predicted arabinose efflux permease, MFS family [Bosea sp. 125]CAD5254558.1 Predicted arabinose efflux permease, MFS family [Bosea sp. 21B]CAD5285924.1 Predicted arabinose efflux permease, MFS family [Bosea sp. 7B]CAD5301431.1 Predicted arabinose efflux permease, MFS family [Bosea sp. 46]VVT57538.1 Predicted arabinose efflux permease, MFS family [Bosea sp. EC-HK365B]